MLCTLIKYCTDWSIMDPSRTGCPAPTKKIHSFHVSSPAENPRVRGASVLMMGHFPAHGSIPACQPMNRWPGLSFSLSLFPRAPSLSLFSLFPASSPLARPLVSPWNRLLGTLVIRVIEDPQCQNACLFPCSTGYCGYRWTLFI